MTRDADDESNDGQWQRDAAYVLELMISSTEFVGGILLAITPQGRVCPVILLPGDANAADVAEILRGALVYVEAGRLHREPKPLPTE